MAKLLYGSPPTVFEVDDRTLAHVEVVVMAKLRRNESFAYSIEQSDQARTTIWIGVHSDLQFVYDRPRSEINRDWLGLLVDSANSTQGLRVMPEDESAA
ncbi:hypothetical protein EYE40_08455 [Glaciihabitans arcticus]|uniref:DUF7882 domain-containing protein n=2 Tax=Glaciihabitans arcticus TaxID=2668039 RepID=A0A4V2JF89_9MICO|nr:hypothetical protein EYE40_08455 [Glaciihabitans arcticus]